MNRRTSTTNLLFLCIMISIFPFIASCAVSTSDPTQDTGTAITLRFWRNSGNDAENSAYDQLVASFMKRYPNIKIEMDSIPFANYDSKLRISIATGHPPDIMAIDAPNMASYARIGALKPLTEDFKKSGQLEDIPRSTIATYTYRNQIYMAPLTESSIALFYNRKMFENAGIPLPSTDPDRPWTWDQVRSAAKKLTDPSKGIYGIDPAQGFQNGGSSAYFNFPIIWQFGGEVMNPEGTSAKGYLDSDATKRALQFFADLYNKDGVSALEYPPDPFANGKLAMTIDGSWSLSRYEEKYPDFRLGIDYDIAPLPRETHQAVANGSWALAISSESKHPEEAWLFVNWVTGHDGQKLYTSITKDIPARYSVARETPELNTYPKNIFVLQDQRYGRPRTITPIFPQMSDAVNAMFEEIVIQKRSVDAAVNEAVNKIEKAYAELQAQ